jgi:hypothetical protein
MAENKYVKNCVFLVPFINLYFPFIDRFTKGVYAISVSGRLPNGVVREMKQRGIPYRPRDTSQR